MLEPSEILKTPLAAAVPRLKLPAPVIAPVVVRLVAASEVKLPELAVVEPIAELSTVPATIVRLLSTSASETTLPPATRSEAVKVSETMALVMEFAGKSTAVVAAKLVKLPDEAVEEPIAALSTVPALISAVSATRESTLAIPSM